MKRSAKRLLSAFLLVCTLTSLCSVFVSAAYIPPDETDSSAYLSSYSVEATAMSSGNVAISVDVTAVVDATRIGATDIYIYEGTSPSGIFTCVSHYTYTNFPAMVGTGYTYCDTPICHQGTVGRYYFANVYCYAGNSTGGDTRVEPTNIVVAHP